MSPAAPKPLVELEKAFAALAGRPRALAETDDLPRGKEPALFRALRAVDDADALARAAAALGERLPDRALLDPLLETTLEVPVLTTAVAAAWRARAASPDAWASERILGALLPLVDAVPEPARPERLLRLVQGLASGAPPVELLEPEAVARDAFVAALETRLGTTATRRDRTSVDLCRGALAALVLVSADAAAFAGLAARIVESEARRAGKEEPDLALAALDALASGPAVTRLRALRGLERRLERRKVLDRTRALADAAEASLGLDGEAKALVLAADGGLDARGEAVVPLASGATARLAIDPTGSIIIVAAETADTDERRDLDARVAQATALRAELAQRLERSMIENRALPLALFRAAFLADHGLLRDLAARIVWALLPAADAAPRAGVRLGTTGVLEDALGGAVDPEKTAGATPFLRPAHPVELDPTELGLWRERFLELGLRQPIDQLWRAVRAEPAAALARFHGRETYQQDLAALARARQWRGLPLRGDGPWDAGRDLPGRGATLNVVLAPPPKPKPPPGKPAAKPAAVPREAAPRAVVVRVELQGKDDPVARAEAAADLHQVTDGLATGGEPFFLEWQKRRWRDPAAAWKEALERYGKGSAAVVETRAALLATLAPAVKVEGRFARLPRQNLVVDLGTGHVHEGEGRDFVPPWKAAERAAAGGPLVLRWPTPRPDPVVELVAGLARGEAAPRS